MRIANLAELDKQVEPIEFALIPAVHQHWPAAQLVQHLLERFASLLLDVIWPNLNSKI